MSLQEFSLAVNGENINLSEDAYYIVCLLIGQGTRDLCAENVQGAPTDSQFAGKELLYLLAHGFADEHTSGLGIALQDTGQVQYQAGQNFKLKGFSYLDFDQFNHLFNQGHDARWVEEKQALAESNTDFLHQISAARK